MRLLRVRSVPANLLHLDAVTKSCSSHTPGTSTYMYEALCKLFSTDTVFCQGRCIGYFALTTLFKMC